MNFLTISILKKEIQKREGGDIAYPFKVCNILDQFEFLAHNRARVG